MHVGEARESSKIEDIIRNYSTRGEHVMGIRVKTQRGGGERDKIPSGDIDIDETCSDGSVRTSGSRASRISRGKSAKRDDVKRSARGRLNV